MYHGRHWIFPLRAEAGSLPPRLEELVLRSDPDSDLPGSLLSHLELVEVREVVRERGASVFFGDRLSWLRETLRGPDGMLPLRLLQGLILLFGSVGETGELPGRDKGWKLVEVGFGGTGGGPAGFVPGLD